MIVLLFETDGSWQMRLPGAGHIGVMNKEGKWVQVEVADADF